MEEDDPLQELAQANRVTRGLQPRRVPTAADALDSMVVPPSAMPGQTIIYVNVPPAPRYKPAAPVRGINALGLASFILGVIACLTCWMPVLGLFVLPSAGLGILLGALGFLIAIIGKRSGVGFPIAGLIICGLAIVISILSTGWFVHAFSTDPKTEHSRSVEDNDTGAARRESVLAAEREAKERAEQAALMAEAANLETKLSNAKPKLDDARQRYQVIERACLTRLESSASYKAAMAISERAEAEVSELRARSAGPSELTKASQDWINAKTAVQNIRAVAFAGDAKLSSAKAVLDDVEAEYDGFERRLNAIKRQQ